MEKQFDSIAEGNKNWRETIREFYGPFEVVVEKVEKELEHVQLVYEESDVKCEKCGRNMVIKMGKYGKFLACPGYPECRNAKPIVEEIDVPCPKCGAKVQIRKTKKRRNYYICENNPASCDYISWNKPKPGEVVEDSDEELKKEVKKKTTTKKNTQSLAVAKDVKKVDAKKGINTLPLIVIFVLMTLITFVGMYNWYYAFGIEVFNDIHTAIMGVKIGDFPIFEHLLSGISQMGYWGNTEFVMIMVIAAALIAWIYKLKLNTFVESFIAGVKKMLPTALYAALASVILTVLYQASYAGTGTLVDTLYAKTFGLTEDFNVVTTGVAALFGSFFYNDLYYLLAGMQTFLVGFDASALSIAGLVIQTIYGVGMIVFPTSVILIAGLSYFNVPFKEWFKYIWKFALAVFILLLIVCCILTII